jgi:ElaB/YqjD/DUF883 family membrane-anchored ribosome-binding protein
MSIEARSEHVPTYLDAAATALDRSREGASRIAERGVDALRTSSEQLQAGAHRAAEQATGYVQDEPVKAILFAAAAGAVLMALLSLLARAASHK